MMTRMKKYKELRDKTEKENKEFELTLKQMFDEINDYIALINAKNDAIDKMLNEIDKNIDELNKAAETLSKKAKEGDKA